MKQHDYIINIQHDKEYINNIIEELKCFLALKILENDINDKLLLPSYVVDIAWQQLILDTRQYALLNKQFKQFFQNDDDDMIYYNPNSDNYDESNRSKLYSNTLNLYKQHFDTIPTESIWEPLKKRKRDLITWDQIVASLDITDGEEEEEITRSIGINNGKNSSIDCSNTEKENNSDHIKICFDICNGEKKLYKVSQSKILETIFYRFCHLHGVHVNYFKFLYNGRSMNPSLTLKDYDVKNGDRIDAFLCIF